MINDYLLGLADLCKETGNHLHLFPELRLSQSIKDSDLVATIEYEGNMTTITGITDYALVLSKNNFLSEGEKSE